MARLRDRITHAWNAFQFQDKHPGELPAAADVGVSYTHRPDRIRYRFGNDKTIVTSIYTRMSIDVAAVPMKHVRVDDNNQYQSTISSGLNDCITVQANVDQSGRQFIQDAVQTLFDEGVIAILPVDTTANPISTGGYDVNSMRVGRITQWFPQHVRIRAYNELIGTHQEVVMPKSMVAIVENPLYAVMNETNSTLQRLLRKLGFLDAVDEQSASGNLDLIIQLPYVIKTTARREEAKKRLTEIEAQLKGSQYGIAYTDGTEKITQLNRPAENNLMGQIQYLTELLYGQLGITEAVMNGTADEPTMINYYNRSIEPILAAIADAMKRSFLTKTARTQGQSIVYIRNPFLLVPVKDLAEIADKMRRNEVLTANDMRAIIGFPPTKDPNADKLQNPNIPVAYSTPPVNGVALSRPQLPPKTSDQQVKAIPAGLVNKAQLAITQGVKSQNGST
jgi:hypothetical protein